MRRLYLNARFLCQEVSGVQRYARELVKALDGLIATGELDPERLALTLLRPRSSRNDLCLSNIPNESVGKLGGHLWEQIELPLYARDGVLVNMCNTAPAIKHNQAVTIHDASVFASPGTYPLAFRVWYRMLLRAVARTRAAIITDSAFSKRELVRYCGMNPDRIHVIYLGKEHILDVDSDESILEKHGLAGRPFVLGVSSITPNKNFHFMVRAIELLACRDFDVAIAGGVNPRVYSQSGLSLPDTVKLLGHVSDRELRALYEHATCFVYPSLYEGFGLPPLEAMACGTPVITSNTSSLPEVVGDAGIMVDPCDVNALASAIRRVLQDSRLRHSMSIRSLRQAERFSWKETARQTLRVYEDLCSRAHT